MTAFNQLQTRLQRRAQHLAGHRRGRLHRQQPAGNPAQARTSAWSGWTTSPPATSATSTKCKPWSAPRNGPTFSFIEGDIRNLADCQAQRLRKPASTTSCTKPRWAACPRSVADPITTNARQHHRLPEHAGGRARCQGEALCLRRQQQHLWRPPRPAQGGRHHWQAAQPLRRHQVRQRAVCRRVCPKLRLANHRPALLQRLRPAPRPQWRLRRRDPQMDRQHDRRASRSTSTATAKPAATSASSPTSCRPTCWPPPTTTTREAAQPGLQRGRGRPHHPQRPVTPSSPPTCSPSTRTCTTPSRCTATFGRATCATAWPTSAKPPRAWATRPRSALHRGWRWLCLGILGRNRGKVSCCHLMIFLGSNLPKKWIELVAN